MSSDQVFEIGTVVWAKIEGHPWWPAKIVSSEEDLDSGVRKPDVNIREKNVPVLFFGDETYAEAKTQNIKPFEEWKEEMMKRCRSAFFRRSVEEARQFKEGAQKKEITNGFANGGDDEGNKKEGPYSNSFPNKKMTTSAADERVNRQESIDTAFARTTETRA